MNRLLTSTVQVLIAVPALYMARIVFAEIKNDIKELRKGN